MKKTKREKAFELFSQGFLPLSPEVKALGLHPSNRYKYYHQWESLGKPSGVEKGHSSSTMVGSKLPAGETVGSIDETRVPQRVEKEEPELAPGDLSQEEVARLLGEEAEEEEEAGISQEIGEGTPGESPEVKNTSGKEESFGGVSEVKEPKAKDGKPRPELKIATTVADDGIKCILFLSLQTLALYKIAASTQAQVNGDEELSLGDFLDTCAEDFFRVRGKKLGLISSGGK